MWGKIARWLLPVSLALNLFFIVLAVRHHPFWHPRPPDAGHIADFMTSGLAAADAAIMQKSFADHAALLDEAHKAGQDFPEKIRAALTANPFDEEALKAALKEGQNDHQKMEDAMAESLVEAAAKMSPQGRATLAARHPFGPPGPGGPGFHHDHDGPPPPK
jgi:uncharacterized membrane protein